MPETPLLPPFPLDLGSELLVEIVNLNLRIKSTLVGLENGLYLIVKISPNDLMGTFRSEAVKESPVVIKRLYKGTVYSFKAEILNVVSAPAKLFFFSYPRQISESKAVSDRHECFLPAITMLSNEIVEMAVVDISREGCQCIIKVPPAKSETLFKLIHVNNKIDVKMQLPGTEHRLAITGKIRNIAKETDKIKMGILFELVPPDMKTRLESFISHISEVRGR